MSQIDEGVNPLVPFDPVTGTDTYMKNNEAQTCQIKIICITAMKQYESRSLEELRLEDYKAGRNAPTSESYSTSTKSPFCQIPAEDTEMKRRLFVDQVFRTKKEKFVAPNVPKRMELYRPDTLLEAQANFSLRLLNAISDSDKNSCCIISPVSISIALAMCLSGAKNKTAEEIKNVISENVAREEIDAYFSSIFQEIHLKRDEIIPKWLEGKKFKDFEEFQELVQESQSQLYTIESASQVFVNKEFPLLEEFKLAINEHYQGKFQEIDFTNNLTAVQEINTLVEQVSKDQIQNLISQESINSLTRMVLVNAIYFKAEWATKFVITKTKNRDFYADGLKTQVPTMSSIEIQAYHETDDFQILGLPYLGHEIYMFIVLPIRRNGLPKLLEQLDGNTILTSIKNSFEFYDYNVNINHYKPVVSTIGPRIDAKESKFILRQDPIGKMTGKKMDYLYKIETRLPRFKLETHVRLSKALQTLGIKDAFCPVEGVADFSGMTGDKKLYIDEVIHKACIQTNEEGTVASAGTTNVLITLCLPPPVKIIGFHAKHPFLCLIATKQCDILFTGIVSKIDSDPDFVPCATSDESENDGLSNIDFNAQYEALVEETARAELSNDEDL